MKVWENTKTLWKHSPIGSCSHNISRSPKLPLVFFKLDRNTEHVFRSCDDSLGGDNNTIGLFVHTPVSSGKNDKYANNYDQGC